MSVCDLKKLFPDVQETEDFLVYLVSSSKPNVPPYRIDMQKFAGAGHCDCLDFQTRKRGQLTQGATPSENLECKHIRRTRRYISFKIINKIIEEREKLAEQNKKAAQEHRSSSFPKTAYPPNQPIRGTPSEAVGQGESWPEDDSDDTPF